MSAVVRPAVFPLSNGDLTRLFEVLRRRCPDLLAEARHLLLGAEAAAALLPPGLTREPTYESQKEMLLLLESEGLHSIFEIIRALGDTSLRRSAEPLLDHLESMPCEEWAHPVDVLRRPWHLKVLLTLCEERLPSRTGRQLKRLRVITERLQAALTLEERAAARRVRTAEALNKRSLLREQREGDKGEPPNEQ